MPKNLQVRQPKCKGAHLKGICYHFHLIHHITEPQEPDEFGLPGDIVALVWMLVDGRLLRSGHNAFCQAGVHFMLGHRAADHALHIVAARIMSGSQTLAPGWFGGGLCTLGGSAMMPGDGKW